MPPVATTRPDRFGLLCLVLAAVGWGSNWPPLKIVLAELPPLSFRAAAGLSAAAVLMVIVGGMGERLAVPRAVWPRLGLLAFLNFSGWMGFSAMALLWLGAAEACLICYTAPTWTVLLAWPVLNERPTTNRLIALASGFLGLMLVVGAPGPDLMARLPGVLAALAAALCFATGTVLTKRRPLPLPPAVAVAWQVTLGALPMLAGAVLFETPDFGGLSTLSWALIGYMAVVPLGLCYLAWFAALRRLPAALAGIGSLLGPLVGVAGSAALLGEPFGMRHVGALALILGGVALAARG